MVAVGEDIGHVDELARVGEDLGQRRKVRVVALVGEDEVGAVQGGGPAVAGLSVAQGGAGREGEED